MSGVDTETISAESPQIITRAAAILQQGGLVVFPTDTVYGVGALACDPQAVRRLYHVKGRAADKAIAVLIGRGEDLHLVASELTPPAQRLAQKFWPGPLTLVVPKHSHLPEAISAGPTVGVRWPDHALAQSLLSATGPLAVTSANISGSAPACTAAEAVAQLGGLVELIIDGGRVPGGVASTVVDCSRSTPQILRPGPIGAEEIAAVWNGESLTGASPEAD